MLVHDVAATSASVRPLAEAVRADGRCVVAVDHGADGVLGLLGVGGMASLERSARQVGAAIDRAAQGRRSVDVVAYGSGSLAVLRSLQASTARRERVHAFVAVGGLWNGTNLAGLGDLDLASRQAGTYRTALAVEHVLLDPVCAVCRELITHSDFLTALQARGLRTPGVSRTDVVSRDDGLVQPFTSGLATGSRHVVVAGVHHVALPSSPTVTRAVRAALGP